MTYFFVLSLALAQLISPDAVVNGVPVRITTEGEAAAQVPSASESMERRAGQLATAISPILLQQLAERQHIVVSDTEVDAEIALQTLAGILQPDFIERMMKMISAAYDALERHIAEAEDEQGLYERHLRPLGLSKPYWEDLTREVRTLEQLQERRESLHGRDQQKLFRENIRRQIAQRKILDAELGTTVAEVPPSISNDAATAEREAAREHFMQRTNLEAELVREVMRRSIASRLVEIPDSELRKKLLEQLGRVPGS